MYWALEYDDAASVTNWLLTLTVPQSFTWRDCYRG